MWLEYASALCTLLTFSGNDLYRASMSGSVGSVRSSIRYRCDEIPPADRHFYLHSASDHNVTAVTSRLLKHH